MGIFKAIFGESKEDKTDRLRTEFAEHLKSTLSVPFETENNEDGLLICIQEDLMLSVTFAPYDDDEESAWRVVIVCPLVFLPTKNLLPFYRKVLDTNGEIDGGYMATEDNCVKLITTLPVDFLTEEAMTFHLAEFVSSAFGAREALAEEFGVQRWEPEE